MAENQNIANALDELSDITAMQHEKARLEELLSNSMTKVDTIFQRISDIPAKIDADNESLVEAVKMVDYLKAKKVEELENVRKRNAEDARKRESLLHAQQVEYKRKNAELDGIREECEYLQTVLTQKKTRVADLEKQMDFETSLFVDQRVALSEWRSKLDSAEPADERRALQSDSVQLDQTFSATQTDIVTLRRGNVELAKELAAVRCDNQLKSIEVEALKSKAAADKEKYDREKEKQQKILTEFRIVEEQRQIEIERMERQLSEQRTAYENAKRRDAELTDRITSEFGNCKPLDEMKAELNGLKDVWSKLTGKVSSTVEAMHSNDTRLQELYEERDQILQQLDRLEPPPTQQQNVQIAEEEQMDDDSHDEFDDSEEERGDIIPQPMDESDDDSDDQAFIIDSPPGSLYRYESPQREAVEDQNVPLACSPDSTVSALTQTSAEADEDANGGADEDRRRLT